MANFPSLQGIFSNMGGGPPGGLNDANLPDCSEQVYVSSLALLKMLKHGRAGVPMEVMGLLLGEFVDDYTINVVDVFSMPQLGNTVSVEVVDHVYQTEMIDQLRRTGRQEIVVGWYHSHPGFGCWFSGTDVNTQQSFEQLNPRAVGIVVDPIQSVKGKVVIDCFRLINQHQFMLGREPRQTTSNIGHLEKPPLTALVHGLNRNYYSISVNYRMNELEQSMLLNLHKHKWSDPLKVENFDSHAKKNCELISSIKDLSEKYNKMIGDELKKTTEELIISNVGKLDAKKRLENDVSSLMTNNILQCLGSMINSVPIH